MCISLLLSHSGFQVHKFRISHRWKNSNNDSVVIFTLLFDDEFYCNCDTCSQTLLKPAAQSSNEHKVELIGMDSNCVKSLCRDLWRPEFLRSQSGLAQQKSWCSNTEKSHQLLSCKV